MLKAESTSQLDPAATARVYTQGRAFGGTHGRLPIWCTAGYCRCVRVLTDNWLTVIQMTWKRDQITPGTVRHAEFTGKAYAKAI